MVLSVKLSLTNAIKHSTLELHSQPLAWWERVLLHTSGWTWTLYTHTICKWSWPLSSSDFAFQVLGLQVYSGKIIFLFFFEKSSCIPTICIYKTNASEKHFIQWTFIEGLSCTRQFYILRRRHPMWNLKWFTNVFFSFRKRVLHSIYMIHAHVWDHTPVCIHVDARKPWVFSFNFFLPYHALRQDLSVNWNLTILAKLAA